ncbi:MAG: DNA-processing protein DprA [Parvibaculales bacterium]
MPDNQSKNLSEEERISCLQLYRSQNVGPISYRQLLMRFGSPKEAIRAIPQLVGQVSRGRRVKICSFSDAEKEYKAIKKLGGILLVSTDDTYPEALAAISDAPPVLTLLGHAHLLRRPMVAFVGARSCSAAGLRITEKLIQGLYGTEYVIVSGLASGIDTMAHKTALEQGTIAVIANGIDSVYPKENAELFARMKNQGLIITENPIGSKPLSRYFPRRNRIISGLSLVVIIVEASLRSGSLITARLAADQGRLVMAVPGSPLDARCHGSNKLLREGAQIVERSADIIDALSPMLQTPLTEPSYEASIHNQAPEEPTQSIREKIIGLLGPTPIEIDVLAEQSGAHIGEVLWVILTLELAGQISRSPGARVSLID